MESDHRKAVPERVNNWMLQEAHYGELPSDPHRARYMNTKGKEWEYEAADYDLLISEINEKLADDNDFCPWCGRTDR